MRHRSIGGSEQESPSRSVLDHTNLCVELETLVVAARFRIDDVRLLLEPASQLQIVLACEIEL